MYFDYQLYTRTFIHNDILSMTVYHPESFLAHKRKQLWRKKEEDDFDRILEEQRQRDMDAHTAVHLNNEKNNVIIRKDHKKEELAQFLHAAVFSPVLSTFIKAIDNGHFVSWPGLTTKLVKRHLTNILATSKGHISQERQKLQSTQQNNLNYHDYISKIKRNIKNLKKNLPSDKSLSEALTEDILKDAFPVSDTPNIKTQEVLYAVFETNKELGYMDLTGRFPYKSSRGHEYILVAYNYDGNAILAQPLKNREAQTIVDAWTVIHERLTTVGLQPKNYLLDNECSSTLKSAFLKHNVGFQLDKPHLHRANAAERAIRTFKEHFKAGLASLDPDFPVREWDRLIPQAEMTLNMLRASRINPKLSAYALLFGQFDYNKTPMVPPGTKVISHLKPTVRASWAANGEEGWTVGPSLSHYRCINCYFPHTRSQKDVDTVTFFPKTIRFPKISIDDFLRQAAMDIVSILNDPPSTTTLSLKVGDNTRNALLEVAKILKRTETIPVPFVTPSPRVNKPSQILNRNVKQNVHALNKPSPIDQHTLKMKKYEKNFRHILTIYENEHLVISFHRFFNVYYIIRQLTSKVSQLMC